MLKVLFYMSDLAKSEHFDLKTNGSIHELKIPRKRPLKLPYNPLISSLTTQNVP